MPNRITNSPMASDVYNHWGMITNNMQCKNMVRQPDGRLWAAVCPSAFQIYLMTSNDNGFSWDIANRDISDVSNLRAVAAMNADGPFVHLVISEFWDHLDVYYAYYESIGGTFDIICVRYSLSDLITNGEDAADGTNITGEASGVVEEDIFQGQFDVAANLQESFITYVVGNKLRVKRLSPRSNTVSAAAEHSTTPVFNMFSTTVNEDSELFVLFAHQTGGENIIKFVEYNETDGWGSDVTIKNFGGTDNEMKDPSIAVDGYGNLCAFWTNVDLSGSDTTMEYAISTDKGLTWSSVTQLTRTEGHAAYGDGATSDPTGRTQVVGGADGGYLIAYTESSDTTDYIAKTYVRRITTTDGSTYTLGDEKEIATNSTKDTDEIVGAHFFLPTPHSRLMDFRDPGLVRVGYTVGDGTSTTQADETPVVFGQELLFSSAYPSILTEDTTTYTIDSADYRSVLVNFEILGGPDENVDYYTLGLTGNFTDRYLAAFDRIGNSIRLLKFEPDEDNYMDDRSAFGPPTSTTKKCIVAPQSYAFPVPDVVSSDHTSWIERDVRKIYLPPDIHISRTFIINTAGYLKRTVWLYYFDGNEYEISQVIPHFIRNQICYYEANSYVVGPSNDPFSRTVLPSET